MRDFGDEVAAIVDRVAEVGRLNSLDVVAVVSRDGSAVFRFDLVGLRVEVLSVMFAADLV